MGTLCLRFFILFFKTETLRFFFFFFEIFHPLQKAINNNSNNNKIVLRINRKCDAASEENFRTFLKAKKSRFQ